jgi:6-phospho-beta-glucosidase
MEGRRKLDVTPSRETAADIMAAIAFDHGFTDVVNMVNFGQIANLPLGAVVETMGYVDAGGARPLTVGPVPEQIRALCAPHAEVQLRTVNAGLSGNLDEALMGLLADPVCACLPASDVKRMGIELLESNRDLLPQFFPCS